MDVDALSKGKRKGKKGSSGAGKGKGQNTHEQCRVLELWQVWPLREGLQDRSGHRTRGGRETKETARAKRAMARAKERKARAKARAKGKGKLNSGEA